MENYRLPKTSSPLRQFQSKIQERLYCSHCNRKGSIYKKARLENECLDCYIDAYVAAVDKFREMGCGRNTENTLWSTPQVVALSLDGNVLLILRMTIPLIQAAQLSLVPARFTCYFYGKLLNFQLNLAKP
ncbi:hypothetical protein Tco_0812347 [Tanacetum coccineum]